MALAERLLFDDWEESSSKDSWGDAAKDPPMDSDDERAILRFPGRPVQTSAPAEPSGSGGDDPPKRRRRKPKKLPTFLNERESDDLLDAAARRVQAAKGPREEVAARRDLELIRFGLRCGLRVAELCALRIEDLDFQTWLATVVQGKGSKDRRLPIPPKIRAAVQAWVGDRRDGYLFAGPNGARLTTRAVQKTIKTLAAAAGLKKRITPHTLRHSFATQTLAHCKNARVVQELLGHDSLATTQKYTHVLPQHLHEAVDW